MCSFFANQSNVTATAPKISMIHFSKEFLPSDLTSNSRHVSRGSNWLLNIFFNDGFIDWITWFSNHNNKCMIDQIQLSYYSRGRTAPHSPKRNIDCWISHNHDKVKTRIWIIIVFQCLIQARTWQIIICCFLDSKWGYARSSVYWFDLSIGTPCA